MRRTKEWWHRLDADERVVLWWYEHTGNYGGNDGSLPDDCSECSSCGNPTLWGGFCKNCQDDYDKLIAKANGETR